MTRTTTAIAAIDCIVKLDNAAGTPTDISGSSNSVNLSMKAGVGQFRAFGGQWPSRLVIGKDADLRLEVVYSTTADEAVDLLRDWFFGGDDSARTLQVDVPDGSVGSDRYSGEVVLESLDIPLSAEDDEVVTVTAELKPDDAFAHSVIS